MTNEIWLLLAALFPAIVLGIYIFVKDRVEKEPIGLLALLLVCGALSAIPVVIVEWITLGLIDVGFSGVSAGALTYRLYILTRNIIGIALVEECFKWLGMWIFTSKNKNFNSLFDGIVYAVFVSLGFAALENVLYSFENGWSTALLRMVTSVPAHTFFAIIMGYYYSGWKTHKKAGDLEIDFVKKGLIQQKGELYSGKKFLFLSILMPVLAHGFYDYCCSVGTILAVLVFVVFLIFLYIYCFLKVRSMSKADALNLDVSNALLVKKYSELLSYFTEKREGM